MGVKLKEILNPKQITLAELKGKKIGIDVSNMTYQFLSSIRQPDGTPLQDSSGNITSHLMGLSTRIPNLMEQDLKLVFVFDGKPPILKSQENQIRRERKELAREKLKKARTREEKLKLQKQSIALDDNIVKESKEFLQALGVPVIQAPSESDAQLAFMNQQNDIYACATTDVDCLLHGAPRIVRNLTASSKKKVRGIYVKVYPELIELQDTLDNLKITQDQLLALSILVGTDYNVNGVKGIGPKNALKLVQQHKNFDELFTSVNADFNWKEIYAVFKSMPIMKNYQLKWTDPNTKKISKILEKHDFSQDRINKLLERFQVKEQKGLDKWF